MHPVLECRNVSRVYGAGPSAEVALREVSLAFAAGQTCLVLGPSGSGKTTLLSILGCLLSPSTGEVRIAGRPVDHASPHGLAQTRKKNIGFVFQHAQLLPFLTMEENLSLVGRNAGLSVPEVHRRVKGLMEQLGIESIRNKQPRQASGGQCQRVAVARAVLHRPPVVLADEPTAALDGRNGETVVRLLIEQARTQGALLLTVSHDVRLAGQFDRVFHMDSGSLIEAAERHPRKTS
jgi:putative ABC transport system ATP-binding protein